MKLIDHSTVHYMLKDTQPKTVDIKFNQGLEWNYSHNAEEQKKRNLLVLDDRFDEAARSKSFRH